MKDLEDQLTASVGAPNNDFDTLAAKYPGISYSVYNSYVNMSESNYIQTILTDTTVGSMLLRLAALTGRPIAYPLLALQTAMADQNLDPTDTFTVTELKAALQTLNSDRGSDRDFTSIAANVYVQAEDRKNTQLAAILNAMVPQVPVGTSTFVPNTNSTWSTPVGPPVDPGTITPSGGDGGDPGGGGRGGGGGGGGGDGTLPNVPEDKEPKSKPEEGSDWFIIIIVLLLLLGVGFAVAKRR